MAIISFDKDTIIDYVPEYAGNRDSDNPCIVRLKYVPYATVQSYAKTIAINSNNKSAKKQLEISQSVQRKQFVNSVESVKGYIVDGKEITDTEEFFDSADTDIIVEIIRAMESSQKLDEGQLKNFEGVSDTNTVRETVAPSTATNVPTEIKNPETVKIAEDLPTASEG